MADTGPPEGLAAPSPGTAAHPSRELPARPKLDPHELLSRLWRQNRPLMEARLACLDEAAQKATLLPLSADDRTGAADIAHKLAGSLGMFGFPEGTTIAREMEVLLEADAPVDTELFANLCTRLREVLGL